MTASATERAAIRDRRIELVRLRESGLLWRVIADRLGYKTPNHACDDYRRALRPGTLDPVEPLRCGTKTAYNRHLLAGESCEVCRLAENERSRERGAGGTPDTCSRCGGRVVRSLSSRAEIVCHPCRRAVPMPVCAQPGCDQRVKSRRCLYCSTACAGTARRADGSGRSRPSAIAPEYGPVHKARRLLAVAAHVDGDPCVICGQPMLGDVSLLDLHHDPVTGNWAGLTHRRCNRSEGATRGNLLRDDRPPFPAAWLAAGRV